MTSQPTHSSAETVQEAAERVRLDRLNGRYTLWRCPKCGGVLVGDALHEVHGAACYCHPNKGDGTACERIDVERVR